MLASNIQHVRNLMNLGDQFLLQSSDLSHSNFLQLRHSNYSISKLTQLMSCWSNSRLILIPFLTSPLFVSFTFSTQKKILSLKEVLTNLFSRNTSADFIACCKPKQWILAYLLKTLVYRISFIILFCLLVMHCMCPEESEFFYWCSFGDCF